MLPQACALCIVTWYHHASTSLCLMYCYVISSCFHKPVLDVLLRDIIMLPQAGAWCIVTWYHHASTNLCFMYCYVISSCFHRHVLDVLLRDIIMLPQACALCIVTWYHHASTSLCLMYCYVISSCFHKLVLDVLLRDIIMLPRACAWCIGTWYHHVSTSLCLMCCYVISCFHKPAHILYCYVIQADNNTLISSSLFWATKPCSRDVALLPGMSSATFTDHTYKAYPCHHRIVRHRSSDRKDKSGDSSKVQGEAAPWRKAVCAFERLVLTARLLSYCENL
jgi:hypothetical protein